MVTPIIFNPPLRIILVEDYTSLREQLVIHLQIDGHLAEGVASGEELDELLSTMSPPDILILDLNLPVEDGGSISARMRQAFPNIGIIMHTVRVSTSEKVKGYAHGADMFISKPASPAEISAVVVSLGRRLHRVIEQIDHRDCTLDMKRQCLRFPNNKTLSLLPAEVLTLYQLALASNGLLESERLLEILKTSHPNWDKLNLEVHFSRLRKKINPLLKESEPCIKSVRGIGYQLCFSIKIKK